MANRTTLEETARKTSEGLQKNAQSTSAIARRSRKIFELFRRWGYYEANLDPLGFFKPLKHPELNFRRLADEARAIYCGTIGAEFMHLPEPERRQWIAERMESAAPPSISNKILERLVRADLVRTGPAGALSGSETIFARRRYRADSAAGFAFWTVAGEHGAHESVIAMSHRGRLNVMVHTACKPAHEVVSGFEDVDPRSVLGAGDVKYHVGATGVFETTSGKAHRYSPGFESQPSGGCRSRGDGPRSRQANAPRAPDKSIAKHVVWPIVMHGDAAFAGQGIWAETLNLADLKAYTVGGTIHIIVNNLIGFTTRPIQDAILAFRFGHRQTPERFRFFTSTRKIPTRWCASEVIAAEYRAKFGSDVVVDLIGYRRHGHSEVDDPTITQPLLYERIKNHPQLWKIYAEQTGIDPAEMAEAIRAEYEGEQSKAQELKKMPHLRQASGLLDALSSRPI